jgi:hypothetical protein
MAFQHVGKAIVSARQTRLQQLTDKGSRGAIKAVEMANHPTSLLSTVQVDITMIGIVSSALGEAAIAKPLQPIIWSFRVVPVFRSNRVSTRSKFPKSESPPINRSPNWSKLQAPYAYDSKVVHFRAGRFDRITAISERIAAVV